MKPVRVQVKNGNVLVRSTKEIQWVEAATKYEREQANKVLNPFVFPAFAIGSLLFIAILNKFK